MLPSSITTSKKIDITFETPNAQSPYAQGLNQDKDILGLCVSSLKISRTLLPDNHSSTVDVFISGLNKCFAYNKMISPDDHMLDEDKEKYFQASNSAITCILNILQLSGKKETDIKSILDFGCGYGRVMRALQGAFPHAELTACDLMADAVDFCADTFQAAPLYGHENLTEIKNTNTFDLIWVGSVFTHLPKEKWMSLIEFFQERLAPEGVLIFTTHGKTGLWVMENHLLNKSTLTLPQLNKLKNEYRNKGFCFLGYDSERISYLSKIGAKLSHSEYGTAFATPEWTCSLLSKFPELFLLSYLEGGWGQFHDVVSVRHSKERVI